MQIRVEQDLLRWAELHLAKRHGKWWRLVPLVIYCHDSNLASLRCQISNIRPFPNWPERKKKEEEEDMKRKQWNERKREMKRGSYLCIHLAPWIWCSGTSSLDEMEIATVSERYGRRRGEKPRWEGIEREREGRREGEWESWNRFMEGSGWRERLPGLYRRETSNYFDAAVGGPPSFLPHLSFFFFSPKNNH